MALAISTDLVRITAADDNTGWTKFGTTTPATEPDYFAQGTGCVSLIYGNPKGGTYDIGAGTIDFNSGANQDKLVYIWMRIATPSLIDTISTGGMYVILGSGTTAPSTAAGVWSAWNVEGSNTIIGTDGWICYVIDPQSTPSTTYGGGVDLNAVRHFGGAHEISTGSAKGQVFGIDAISYGRGELYITGAVATAGEGFKEAAALDFGTIGTRYGIITEKRGIYYVRGKLVLRTKVNTRGANAWTVAVSSNTVTVNTIVAHGLASDQKINTNSSWTTNAFMASLTDKTITVTGTTTFTFALTQGNQGATAESNTAAVIAGNVDFSSYGEQIVFETPHYYNATAIVKSIPDASVGSVAGIDGLTSYNGLAFVGDSVGRLTSAFGVSVGTAQGRSGSTFSSYKNPYLGTPARTLCTVCVDNNANSVSIYGSTFNNLEGQIDLRGTNVDDDDCFSNTFNGCGRIDSNMEIRNCYVLNSVASATDGAYLWTDTTNLETCSFVNCSRGIVFESSTGTPFTFTSISFSGNTYDVRNESGGAITINYAGAGATTPTYENSGGGSSTTVSSSVTVAVNVVDKDDVPISLAQVGVYVGATQVINTDTDGSGNVTGSWSGSVPANAVYKIRKSSPGTTKYISVSGPGIIAASTGMSVKVVMQVDTTADPSL